MHDEKPRGGYRLFRCECGREWKDKSRDCYSPSGEACEVCGEWISPHRREPHPEWLMDLVGNFLPADAEQGKP